MVERYEHGDPMPTFATTLAEHSVRLIVGAISVAFILGGVGGLFMYQHEKLKAQHLQFQFKECIQTEGAKMKEEMLKAHWPLWQANDQSKTEVAPECCKKLGRVPLFTGESAVCLKPTYVDLSYPSYPK